MTYGKLVCYSRSRSLKLVPSQYVIAYKQLIVT